MPELSSLYILVLIVYNKYDTDFKQSDMKSKRVNRVTGFESRYSTHNIVQQKKCIGFVFVCTCWLSFDLRVT